MNNSVMMTTNKLTKILCGVATLGIATAMATPAQASSFTVPLGANGNSFVNATIAAGGGLLIGAEVRDSVILGDKLFSDFSFSGDVGVGDTLNFFLDQDVWTVNFIPSPDCPKTNPPGKNIPGVCNGKNGNGKKVLENKLEYKVTISDPKLVFDMVGLDTDISGPPGKKNYLATKQVFTLDDKQLITLTSTNGSEAFGSILSFNAKTIKVVDTFTSLDNGKSRLQSSTNDFTQAVDPPSSIPEPGTILGILTVGGLGLVSRFKKQK
ncbi:MAG: PEP-CTERM sorting domain-containing protein [Microcystis aeruginosa]